MTTTTISKKKDAPSQTHPFHPAADSPYSGSRLQYFILFKSPKSYLPVSE